MERNIKFIKYNINSCSIADIYIELFRLIRYIVSYMPETRECANCLFKHKINIVFFLLYLISVDNDKTMFNIQFGLTELKY